MTEFYDSSGRAADTVVPHRTDEDPSWLEPTLDTFRQATLDDLNSLFGRIDRAALGRAVQALAEANSVFVVGVDAPHPLAICLHHHAAIRVRNWRFPVWRDGELSRVVETLTPTDVVFAIEVQTHAIDAIALARRARDVGTRVIAITDAPQSSLVDCANEVLLVPAGRHAFPPSLVGVTTLVEMLVDLVAGGAFSAGGRSAPPPSISARAP